MVDGSRKNKVNNPSHPSRTYSKRLRDVVTSSIYPVTVPLSPFCQCLV